MARRDFADAMRQNLIALAMSAGAIAATPRMSAGLSGSAGSAAIWSHRIASADCAQAGGENGTAATARPMPAKRAMTPGRLVMMLIFASGPAVLRQKHYGRGRWAASGRASQRQPRDREQH